MAGTFTGLTDTQWRKLSRHIPRYERGRGRRAPSRRKLLNTILYVLITGCRWCDVPVGKRWGKRSTSHEWLGIWSKDGVMTQLRQATQEEAELYDLIDWERGSIDGSFASGKGGGEGVDYGFKGKGVTIHALVDGNGMPLAAITTSARESEQTQVIPLLEEARIKGHRRKPRSCPDAVQMDKGYDSQALRQKVRNKGARPMIAKRHYENSKQKCGRKPASPIDRWKVERAFSWFQRKFRRLCVRWERRKKYWDGFLEFAISFMWLVKTLEVA